MKVKFFFSTFIIAFLIGYGAFFYLGKFVDTNKTATPWIFITILLFPASYCFQALLKISESDEHTSLTNDELRRLKPIIKNKKNWLCTLLFFYIFSALFIALVLFSIPANSTLFMKLIYISGGSIFSAIYSLLYIKSIMDEIQSFKSKLLHRADEEKKRKELIDSLRKNADK